MILIINYKNLGDPNLLSPARHHGAEAWAHLAVIRARQVLVSARTMLVNAARGLTKWFGERLCKCGKAVGADLRVNETTRLETNKTMINSTG